MEYVIFFPEFALFDVTWRWSSTKHKTTVNFRIVRPKKRVTRKEMADGFGFDEFNAFSGPRTALKSAINMRDLVDEKPFKFEIDRDNFFGCEDDSDSSSDERDWRKPNAVKMYEDPELQWQPDTDEIRLDQWIDNYDELEKQMEVIHESGNVKKLVVKRGSTIRVAEDAKIFIHYAAFAEGEMDAFDKTMGFGKRKPLGIFLTGKEIILGLQIGLKTMCIGEISKFMINPIFAFGEMGCPPRIPAGARIVFTVELLRFVPKEKFADVLHMSVDDRAELPFGDILQAALTSKKQGNTKYYDGDYRGALKLYSRGIDLLENFPTSNEEDNAKRDGALPELCCNKAQCLLKLESPTRACVACKLGLRTADELTKAKLLIRFAEAKYLLNSFKEARDMCNQAIKIFKASKILDRKHTDLQTKIIEAIEREKKLDAFLCRQMLKLDTTEASSSNTH
ncbi:unnamed protein product [Allacma fusca]|uniref:peptidylprolyl isomerase n=1 Tax=Allacma fusca TaxID=39272 RepID=A0A8J2LQB2_9HEXA|nr:unnamed protein product [Allacma fusca]